MSIRLQRGRAAAPLTGVAGAFHAQLHRLASLTHVLQTPARRCATLAAHMALFILGYLVASVACAYFVAEFIKAGKGR